MSTRSYPHWAGVKARWWWRTVGTRFNTARLEVIADRTFTYAIISVLVAEGVVVVIAMLWAYGLLRDF